MKKIGFACICVLLTACATVHRQNPPADPAASSSSIDMTSSFMDPQPIEPYPEEFSVEYFQQMTLSGSDLQIGKMLDRNDAYTRSTLTYRSNGVLVSGTISIPNGEGPYPLIIQNHGYIDPAVYTNGRGLRREQDAFARAGFAVLHTDYRKHAFSDPDPDTRDIYDNALAYALDSANAVLATRELNDPRIDATKVGMIGHSMGGGVTLHILVAHPDLIDAAVLYAPISTAAWQNFERWQLDDDPKSNPTLEAFGLPEDNTGAWEALSQTGMLMNVDDSVLLFHGTNDKDVPLAWSNALDRQLQSLGKDITYVVYPGEGHEFGLRWNDFIQQSIAFFSVTLRAEH